MFVWMVCVVRVYSECNSCNRETVRCESHSVDGYVNNAVYALTFLLTYGECFLLHGIVNWQCAQLSGGNPQILVELQCINNSSQLLWELACWVIITLVLIFCLPHPTGAKYLKFHKDNEVLSAMLSVYDARYANWSIIGIHRVRLNTGDPWLGQQVHLTWKRRTVFMRILQESSTNIRPRGEVTGRKIQWRPCVRHERYWSERRHSLFVAKRDA
jgi:hypothetical protein